MKSKIAHLIKHRKVPNDDFETPEALAKKCISLVPFEKGDEVLDPFAGNKVFLNNFPDFVFKEYTEIKEGIDFFKCNEKCDWAVSNPPYSKLDKVFEHTYKVARKGFGYLIGIHNLTAKRIEEANEHGFYLTKIHMCKVFKFFGMSIFVVFEKNKKNIISYDRTVWR